MRESFYWGVDLGEFLFHGLTIKSTGGLIGVCIVIFVMAFVFEYLRFLQTKHRQRELKIRSKQLKMLCTTESSALLRDNITNPKNPLNITLFHRALLFGTEISLWLTLQNLGYFIMLSVMVYDAWLLVAAVVGGGFGYFIFGQRFMKINLQNCQIIRDTYCTQICGEADKTEGQSTPALERPSTSIDPFEAQTSNVVHVTCH